MSTVKLGYNDYGYIEIIAITSKIYLFFEPRCLLYCTNLNGCIDITVLTIKSDTYGPVEFVVTDFDI